MEHSELRTDLTKVFENEKKQLKYPYIFIPVFGRELALFVKCLTPGPVPVTVKHNGQLKKIGSCSLDALELHKISRVYKYEVVLSETDRRPADSVETIMEVLPWMVSLSSSQA